MDELKLKVQRKLELKLQRLDLEAEKKKLAKEVFDLRIAANNEQVDVENLEGFSVKGLLLQISGKKEERLEQEKREARHAKAQYDFAAARLAGIELQLAQIPTQLEELGNCEESLLQRLQEQFGCGICQEHQMGVQHLSQVIHTVNQMREAGNKLHQAIEELCSWIGADRRSSMVSRKYHAAEVEAISMQEVYFEHMARLKEQLKAAQLEMDTSGWQVFDKNYMEGMMVGQMSRCMEVSEQVVGIDFQLKAVLPKLNNMLQQRKVDLMNALLNVHG